MLKNFKLPWKGMKARDPRIVMRVVIGLLLIANLAAAVIAFKPFGGSAEDLRRQTEQLRAQLVAAQGNVANSKRLVDKVVAARTDGDEFLSKYFLERRTMSSTLQEELNRLATDAGIKAGTQNFSEELVEGSDALSMMTVTAGFEGTYANLTKLVHLIDRSPRFLIIENMQLSAPQGQSGPAGQGDKPINVTLRIDTFVRGGGV